MPEEDDVAQIAAALRLELGRLARRVRAETPVGLGRLAVLGSLDREGPQTTAELAVRQVVRHQSMARTVAQLAGAGYVASSPHPDDGRKTVLRITPAGRDVLEAERARRVDWLARVVAERLTAAERRELARGVALLGRLAEP